MVCHLNLGSCTSGVYRMLLQVTRVSQLGVERSVVVVIMRLKPMETFMHLLRYSGISTQRGVEIAYITIGNALMSTQCLLTSTRP